MPSAYYFVQSETSWWRRVILPVIIFAAVTLLIIAFINIKENRRRERLLSTVGVTVQGRLDNSFVRRMKNYRQDYRLIYYFVANDQRYSGTAVVDKLPSKMEVQITYVPSDPTINKLSEPSLESADHFWSDIVVVALVGIILSLISGAFNWLLGSRNR
jgi:hypothetical protein